MLVVKHQNWIAVAALSVSLPFFSGCLTPAKMDRFVGDQYNNEIPKEDKKKKADITVSSVFKPDPSVISNTFSKTSKMLPLIVYWQWEQRKTCTLNPAIGVTNFANAINSIAAKGLAQKLNGQKLELTVEQVPTAFALVDKAHLIFIIYAITWDRVYMEPDFKDLVVSYKLLQNNTVVKTGKISIKNDDHNRGLRFFQTWKSAISEYLADYNASFATMSKAFVNKLMEEL